MQCRGVRAFAGASSTGGQACRGSGVAAMEGGGAPVERGLSRSHFPRSSAMSELSLDPPMKLLV